MESAVGSFGREVRSHSKTFANIANRGVLRAQINAIKAKIPDLEPEPTLPHGSFPFGDGYALLRAIDSTRRTVTDREAIAIRASGIADASIPSTGAVLVRRWAQLLLPNGQVARCTWKEKSGGERVVCCARNVKVCVARSTPYFISQDCFSQVVYNGEERFGEVCFFYHIGVEENQWHPVALMSLYSAPDPALLKFSSDTLLVCRYHADDSLVLVNAQSIKSVIAMVPFMEKPEGGRPRRHNGRFFVVEKPGLSLAELGMEEGLELLG